jgi:hypothetical protein
MSVNETTIDTAFRMFPWIGGAAAIVLLILLFGTRVLQSRPDASRWHDGVWLSWAALTAYLLHNVEEYGIDLFGRRLGFPDGFCALLNQPALPECPIPPLFFMAVNIPLFWVAAPIAASLSRRHTLVGLALYGVIIVNACLHIVPFVAGGGYSSGTLTAIVLFVPLSAWLGRTCFGPGRMGYRTLVLLIVLGVIGHALLMAPLQMFLHGWITERALVFSQFVNPIVLLLAPWLVERWNDGLLPQPRLD